MKSYVYDKKSIPDHYRAHRIDSLNIDKEEDGVEKKDFIWKMGGQQGQGVESCGEILGRVLAQEGYSLFSQRLFASRIKGGHTTIALRIATKEIATIGEHVDCLVALDQETIDLHGKEICEGGVIIADDAFKPKWETHTGRIFLPLPITEMAKKYGSMQMKNIAALGMSAGLLGFPETPFYRFIAERFAKKGEAVINKNKEIFKEGYDTAIAAMQGVELGKLAVPEKKDQLYLLGNEAAALGAISAGSRFMASYPITPASEIMEYMIKVAHKIHGTCSVMTKVELNPDHTIESVEVLGGCNGNLKGICQLLKGMKAEDAIERMKGTLCGSKPTSCPDQIAITLEEALQKL